MGWIDLHGFPLHNPATGETVGVIEYVRNITDQREAELALQESEQRLRLINENMVDLITHIDKNRKVLYCSPSAERLTGYPAADLISHTMTEFIHPDDVERIIREIRAAIGSQAPFVRLEYRYLHKNGTYSWFESEARILYDSNGAYDGTIFTSRDVTDRKKAEKALLESEDKYRSVIDKIHEGFVRGDKVGNLVIASPSAARLLGYHSPSEMTGMQMDSHYRFPGKRQVLLDQMRKQNGVDDYEIEFRRKDGSTFWGSLDAHFIFNEQGEITGTEAVIRDITERKNMENAIREANRKLSLLSGITRHDVANQLAILRGYLEIASSKNPDPVMAEYLAKIDAAAREISTQVEFTKTYQELGVHAPAWFCIGDIIEKTAPAQMKLLNNCNRYEIFADPMLERVFFNLFDNARRHGGNVTEITVECRESPGGLGIFVEDNGTGIPTSEKEKIFGQGYGRNTGFGLFLVREILSITGITIRETGVEGKGARFEILVPDGAFRPFSSIDRTG